MFKHVSWVELAFIAVLLLVGAAILLPALARSREGRPNYCQNNLKQMGLVFKMYSNESKGERFPPLMATAVDLVDCDAGYREVAKGGFIAPGPAVTVFYPEYMSDSGILSCPSDAGEHRDLVNNPKTGENEILRPCDKTGRGMQLVDMSYQYLGWVFDKAACEDGAYRAGIVSGPRQMVEVLVPLTRPWRGTEPATAADAAKFDEDRPVPKGFGNGPDGDKLYRLREGIERFLITDINNPAASARAQSLIWVMWDRVEKGSDKDRTRFNHIPGGCNVLYMDGHVAFTKFEACADAPANSGVADVVATSFGG